MVYLLKMVILHGYVSHNQIVDESRRFSVTKLVISSAAIEATNDDWLTSQTRAGKHYWYDQTGRSLVDY